VDRAFAGDEHARRELVAALTPVIQRRVVLELFRRRSLARGRDLKQEVDDMTQQVFLSFLENDGRALRAWSAGRGLSLTDFVELLAARQVASILRSGRRSPWKEDAVAEDELEAHSSHDGGPELLAAARRLGAVLLERLRDELSPKGLELFELLFVREQDVDEVTRSLAMSADAVYAWRSRLARLARRIAKELQEDPHMGEVAAENAR
jgi:RNA polymerase sigma-70 factor (ECF subfamily)